MNTLLKPLKHSQVILFFSIWIIVLVAALQQPSAGSVVIACILAFLNGLYYHRYLRIELSEAEK